MNSRSASKSSKSPKSPPPGPIPSPTPRRADPGVLEGLNPEQRQAVLSTRGPLLIIAGAGTGKTRVIAHRVAHLLQSDPSLAPSNVLAMTFSRKAAQEMLERVESMLGGYADELGVFTFHGFCHRFLQDHAAELGLPARFRLLDRVESWILFRRLLPELKLFHHWSLSDPTECIHGFLRFISRAKDELVTPDDFAAYVRGVSDPHERSRAEEVERAYRGYQRKLREEGLLDFGDLVVETLRALKERPALLAGLRAQYRHILVDEFQDTNVAQIALLGLLAAGSGSVCVVGDDDQAIYRFRGASFASFLMIRDMFPEIQTVRLTRNYRSSQRVLSVANRLIRHNTDRYDSQKQLSTDNPAGTPVSAEVCRDEWHETSRVIELVRALHADQPEGDRRYDRIAVLYRAHAHRDRLVEALRQEGIPFSIQGGTALFEQPEIKDMIAFLRVLHDPGDSLHLFRVLSHPAWGLRPEELIALSRAAKERRVPLLDVLRAPEGVPLGEASKAAVARLLEQLGAMFQAQARGGVGELVPKIAEQTSLRLLFLGEKLSLLGRFLRFTYRYAQDRSSKQDLGSFLWYLDSYLEAGGDVSDDEEELPGDRLRLMTIHQAKGLEFDWVILLSMVQGKFPARSRPEPIPFPVELMKESLPSGDYHLQEERRLCYVACTRARRGLFLMTQERAYHRSSAFVREMLETPADDIVRRMHDAAAADAPPQRRWAALVPSASTLPVEREVLEQLRALAQLPPGDEAGFRAAVEKIGMLAAKARALAAQDRAPVPAPMPLPDKFSYTQLETYRYCPMKYQYSYIYQIPMRPTPQMSFGIDLHAALEKFFARIIEGGPAELEQLLEAFRAAQAPGRYGEPFQEQEYRRLGIDLLTAFYKKHEGSFGVPLHIEKQFLLPVAGAWVRGVIDRVDPLPGGGVEIIDYKSGKPKDDADADEQLQLRLYALACKEIFELEPRKISFYFLRNNEKLSFPQEPEKLDEVKQKITGLVEAIRTGGYEPTPSMMKCRRCDFKTLCPASMA